MSVSFIAELSPVYCCLVLNKKCLCTFGIFRKLYKNSQIYSFKPLSYFSLWIISHHFLPYFTLVRNFGKCIGNSGRAKLQVTRLRTAMKQKWEVVHLPIERPRDCKFTSFNSSKSASRNSQLSLSCSGNFSLSIWG